MINKKESNNNNLSGIYEVIFENTLNPKDWVYNWFIIKNFFREFNFYLYDFNDNYPQYLNIVNNSSLKKFYGEFIYSGKSEDDYLSKELINYFEKYNDVNNIRLKSINVKNIKIKESSIMRKSTALGSYNIQLNKPIHPTDWTYHWFIIKNMFAGLNYEITELNDNYPEYRYIIGEKDIFTLNTFKNPKIRKENYLDVFEGICCVYNNKTNISTKNLKKYEEFRDTEIHKVESFFEKYFKSNNISVKTIDIAKDKISYY